MRQCFFFFEQDSDADAESGVEPKTSFIQLTTGVKHDNNKTNSGKTMNTVRQVTLQDTTEHYDGFDHDLTMTHEKQRA